MCDIFNYIGTITGVVGVILAIIFYYKGKKIKKLTCYKTTVTILDTECLSEYPKLKILYDNKDIQSLNSTQITVLNNGYDIIEKNDFMPMGMFKIETSGKFLFEDITEIKIYNSNKNNRVVLTSIDESHLQVNFDCLRLNDAFRITIQHTGEIFITGMLKSGTFELSEDDIFKLKQIKLKDKVLITVTTIVLSLLASPLILIFANTFIQLHFIIRIIIIAIIVWFIINTFIDFCKIFLKKY